MKNMRWSDDEDALHEDLGVSSPNEQLLRYISMPDSSVEIERGYLHLVP